MSTVKGCKRCKYDKSEYEIYYRESAQKQKICYKETKVCSKCNYISPYEKIIKKEAELDNYPSDMNVDLSKIVHEHNHNKFSHIRDKTEYNKGICTKLTLTKYYKCDICDKIVDYTEIEEFKEYKDIYDKTEYIIDYKTSAQKQKIYYKEITKCSKSKHVYQKCKSKIAELDNYPKDMIVDLSKIIPNNKKEDKVIEEKQNKSCNKETNKEQFNEKSKNTEKRSEIYDKINELDNNKVKSDNHKLNEDIFDIIHRMDIENLDDSDDDEITIIHYDNDHKSSNKCPHTGKKFYMRKGYVLDDKYKYNNCSIKPHVLFEECSECHRCFYAGMIYC